MQKAKVLLRRPSVRYLIVGASAYFIEFTILLIFTRIGWSATLSTAISFWFGLSIAFFLQKFVTFGSNDTSVKKMGKQTAAYLLLVLFNYAFTITFVSVLPSNLILFTRTVALVITTSWNFFLYKRLFKS